MENFIKDARFAVRSLRRQPGFALTAITTLALAIGASTAIFSVVEATLLRALPFAQPDRLAFMWGVAGPERAIRGASYIEAQDWRRMSRAFDGIAIYDETSLNLRTAEGTERVEAEMVSASYWEMLGVNAQLGRTFTATEDSTPNTHPVITISHEMWTNRFGSNSNIIGTSLTLNERPFTIIGVMPPGFSGLSFDTDIWFPAAMIQANGGPANLDERSNRWLGAVGRVRTDMEMQAAQVDADRVAAQIAKDFPESNTGRGILLQPLREAYLGTTSRMLWSVFGAVGLLLLIACANVLGLQLVRAAARTREIALRLAIGADRKRLVQQLVVEGLVLASIAAVVGLLLAHWILQGLLALAPDGLLPGYAQPEIALRALGFVLLVTLGCGVLFGLIPAFKSSRVELGSSLREGSRGSATGFGAARRFGSQQFIVVAETAVALVLLIGAGLFVRSLQRELSVNPGFEARDLLRAGVAFPQHYDAPRRVQVAQQIQERLSALPSVRAVAIGSDLPLAGGTNASFIHIREAGQRVRYYRHNVAPGFTDALGMRVVRGRSFTADDRAGAPNVVMINESAAKRFWPGQDVVGREIRQGTDSGLVLTIVGVVADTRYRDLTTPLATTEPDVFFPYAQRPVNGVQIALRSTLPPENLATAMRREITAVDPAISVFGVRPMEELLKQQTATGRFASSLLGVFGACALVLTAVGLYGVLAFLVGMRSREIGIRMALGATRARVLRSVMGQGLVLVAAGVVVGVAIASGVTRYVGSLLFGVDTHDTVVFAFVPVLLLLVALAASWLPARRAAALDPQMSLRSE